MLRKADRSKGSLNSFMYRLSSLGHSGDVCRQNRIELWNLGPFLEEFFSWAQKLNDKFR